MAISTDSKRVLTALEKEMNAVHAALNKLGNTLRAYEALNVHADVDDEVAGAVVLTDGGQPVTKERAIANADLGATILFHIDNEDDGAGNTITGRSALTPSEMQDVRKKYGV